jgi:hypothetical protein
MQAQTLIKAETLRNGDYVRIIRIVSTGAIVKETRTVGGAFRSERIRA